MPLTLPPCNFRTKLLTEANGVGYEVDELTNDLCREDEAKRRRLAYTPEQLTIIKAKHQP